MDFFSSVGSVRQLGMDVLSPLPCLRQRRPSRCEAPCQKYTFLWRSLFTSGRPSQWFPFSTKITCATPLSEFERASRRSSHSALLWKVVRRHRPDFRQILIPRCYAVKMATETQRQEERKANLSSRRTCFVLTAPLAVMLAFPNCGQTLSRTWDLQDNLSHNAGHSSTLPVGNAAPAATPAPDVKSWYLYRGEGFNLRIPPGYDDILEPTDEDTTSSYAGERAKQRPFAARFASPDRDEVLSVVVKPASQLRLSFFEIGDITDFGSLKDAAGTFVPAGAKIISARSIDSKATRVPRKYYVFEFLMRGMHFSLSAGISKGRLGIAPSLTSSWEDLLRAKAPNPTLRSVLGGYGVYGLIGYEPNE